MNAVTRSESSPRRVRIATPSTPIRSPRSSPTRRSKPSSPSSSTRACSWMRPVRSTRSMNAARPPSRRAAMRPATRCAAAVSSPAASPSCAASTVAIGSTSAKRVREGLDAVRAQPFELRPPHGEQLRKLLALPAHRSQATAPHALRSRAARSRRSRPSPASLRRKRSGRAAKGGSSRERPYFTPTSILVIFSLRAGPRGTCTETISLRRWPSSARPTGDSLESLFSAGLASAEPTIV